MDETLERELVLEANALVGITGPSTSMQCAVTGENYVKYWAVFKERNEIKPVFLRFIKNYMGFVEGVKREAENVKTTNALKIYWRNAPLIEKHGGLYSMKARLLISRGPY